MKNLPERRSSLRAAFDAAHVKAIDAVCKSIVDSDVVLQAPGKDGWVITVGQLQRGSESGYGCTFDPPSGYEDLWFRTPKSAAKAFVDAVGAKTAQETLREIR